MGLFGNRAKKEAKKAAAAAESERLVGLSVVDLAVAVMPAFGPGGIEAKSGHQQGAMEVTEWLFRNSSTAVEYRQPTLGPVIEALQALDNAGLLEKRSFGGGSTYHATRAGEEALAGGSVRERLASTS